MRIIYSVFLSLILNSILILSIVFLITNMSYTNFVRYKPLKITLQEVQPIEENTIAKQLGNLVKNVSTQNMKPALLAQTLTIQKKTLKLETVPTIKKKTLFVLKNKPPTLITKNNVPLPKANIVITMKKKTLGEQVLVGNISKHYFELKNIGITELMSRKNVYEVKNLEMFPVNNKRVLDYDFLSNSNIEKKLINFDELANIEGGNITFHNVPEIKQVLHEKYMRIVQNAVNNNLAFPGGKVTIEAVFYPDGMIKINYIKGANSSPSLQDLLKTSIQSLSFTTTKKVIMDITYNFESKPGGLK